MNRDDLIAVIQQWLYVDLDPDDTSVSEASLADTILELPYSPPPEVMAKLKEQRALWAERVNNDMPRSHYWSDMLDGGDKVLSILGLLDVVTEP